MSLNNLDIVFCVDNTASMNTYIQSTRQNIQKIVEEIVKSEKANVRFGLVHYRDHKDDYVAKKHDFTDNMSTILGYVNQMAAAGGGDGPEAVAAAFRELNTLEWRRSCTKIVVFIADAPPHGIEPKDDHYPDGDPKGIDPIEEVRELMRKEVMIYSVGCEPEINQYAHARSFMKAVADLTGGKYLSLARVSILSEVIIYGAREELNLDRYANLIEDEVTRVKHAKENINMEMSKVYEIAATNLQTRGIITNQMKIDEVVDKKVFAGVDTFLSCENLKEAKPLLQKLQPVATTPTSSVDSADQCVQMESEPITMEQVQRVYERRMNANNKPTKQVN